MTVKIPESKLVYFQELENTNRELMTATTYEDGDGVYTTNQLEGKGTKGRRWQEAPGKGLAISFLYHLPKLALPPLPLIVGLSVRQGLKGHLGLETSLKWSNDILAQDKKIVGILCESRLEEGFARVVIGIGININQTQEEFLRDGLVDATSLYILGRKEVDSNKLAKAIQTKLHATMGTFFKEGFQGTLLQEYENHCLNIGQALQITRPNQPSEFGKGVGISPEGALRYLTPEGQELLLYSGDVSVRGRVGYI